MIRGTTPDFLLEIEGYDVTGMTVFVTLSQGYHKVTKTNEDLLINVTEDGSEIGLSLSQADTLGLRVGTADVQVRMIDRDGHADATETAQVNISRVLLEGVIRYADG